MPGAVTFASVAASMTEDGRSWLGVKALQNVADRHEGMASIADLIAETISTIMPLVSDAVSDSFIDQRKHNIKSGMVTLEESFRYYLADSAICADQLTVVADCARYLTSECTHVEYAGAPSFWGYAGFAICSIIEMLITQERILKRGGVDGFDLGSQIDMFHSRLAAYDTEFLDWIDRSFSQPELWSHDSDIATWMGFRFNGEVFGQGQRPLSLYSRKDFQQDVVVPAASAAVHGDTFLVGLLLEQRKRMSIQPRQVLAELFLADA